MAYTHDMLHRARYNLLCLTVALAGCASGFRIDRVDDQEHATSNEVTFIASEPTRPYTILARFQGQERDWCARAEPYCSLQRAALRLGADAVWIQQRRTWTRPDQWMDINGQWTRIYGHTTEQLEGVILKYRD